MSDYIIAFVIAGLLMRVSLFAVKIFAEDKIETTKQFFSFDPWRMSAHAAFVAMVPAAFFINGLDSKQFKIAAIIAVALVLIDFIRLGGTSAPFEDVRFKTKLAIFVRSWAGPLALGTIFGFLVTAGLWWGDTFWFSDRPTDSEARWYLWLFTVLFVGSLGLLMWLRRRPSYKTSESLRMRQAITRAYTVPAATGLFIAFLQDQTRNITFTNRYFTITIFATIIVLELWYAVTLLPGWRKRLKAEQQELAKENKKNRSRKKSKKRR